LQGKNFIHCFTKILIDIMFFGGIIVTVTLPLIMKAIAPYSNYLGIKYPDTPRTIFLMISGVLALFLLWELRKLFKSLNIGNPFMPANVGSLKKCAVCAFLISAMYALKILTAFTMASVIICIIFAILGLFSLTLKDLFRQAVKFKEENDFTI